jgi:hypothetical protein
MRITELRLKTADLEGQRDFYAHILRLPVIAERGGRLSLQVGTTRLVFEQQDDWQGRYHFAFDVPENQFDAAQKWITQRTSLVKLDGQQAFKSAGWNAHNFYFYDAAGNILECIARHNQATASNIPFSEKSLLYISEIGLATDDVAATVRDLCHNLNVSIYDGEGSDTFTAVGDEEGLFIVVKRGRIWYPNTGIASAVNPVTIGLADAPEAGYNVPGLPYVIRSTHERQPLSSPV